MTRSALHLAHKNGNDRVTDIILSNMAQIEINNSHVFRQILFKLTDISNFGHYLDNLLIQTNAMKDKKVLRIRKPLNEKIIAMESHHTAFIDEDFYKEKFEEKANN